MLMLVLVLVLMLMLMLLDADDLLVTLADLNHECIAERDVRLGGQVMGSKMVEEIFYSEIEDGLSMRNFHPPLVDQ